MHGANHEMNLRAGTENVMEIVGLGHASSLVLRDLNSNMESMRKTKQLLADLLLKKFGSNIRFNGHSQHCLPNTLSVSFSHTRANDLIDKLKSKVALSAGAACHSEGVSLSHVLKAINIPMDYAMGTIRFSTGKQTKKEDIFAVVEMISNVISDKKN